MSDNDEATPAPVAEQAPSVEQFDPMTADLGELREKLERGIYAGDSGTAPEAEPIASPIAEPEPEAQPEATPEEPPPAEESPEAAPPPSMELLMARIEESEARTKHMESVLGREAGAADYWRKQADRLQRQLAERQTDRGQEDDGREPRLTAQEAVERGVDPMARYVVQLAAERAVESFTRARPDLAQGGAVDPEFGQIILRLQPEVQRIVSQHYDPIAAAAHVGAILNSAASEFDLVLRRRNREAIEKRSADQAADLKKRKLASAAASTGAKPARAKPATPDPMTMPMEQLRKQLDRAYGV